MLTSYGYMPDTHWTAAAQWAREASGYVYFGNDHLATPRLALISSGRVHGQTITSAFGVTAESGNITSQLRFPGQYFDSETGLHYNWNRYYDPSSGRYITSDPIGLIGGLNTYAYALANPVSFFDPDGLEVRFICRSLAGFARYTGKQHCFVHVSCPEEGWSTTLSLFSTGTNLAGWPNAGAKHRDDPRDDPSGSNFFDESVTGDFCSKDDCEYEKAVLARYNSFPEGNVPYSPFGPNSNSFAQDLVTGTPFPASLPSGAPGPNLAPGVEMSHPSFPRDSKIFPQSLFPAR